MGQTIAEAIWEERVLKGRTEGQLKNARLLLQELLAARFGTVPEAVLQRIATTNDVGRLNAAVLQVASLTTPERLEF